jgi:hypothetical protein
LNQAIDQIQKILQGQYLNVNGEERLQMESGHYVKINFASSGQQEVVWILNLLFYYLVNNKKVFFIIEEPESHLYPNTQKLIMEYISLAKADHNRILVTTHSPYILRTVNNLLFADAISGRADRKQLNDIIPKKCWIHNDTFQAYYMQQGKPEDCMDHDSGQVKNELIDGASCTINEDYDMMLELVYGRNRDASYRGEVALR